MTICKSCGINTDVYGVCSYNPAECGMEAKPWAFPDESPHVETLSDVWYYAGFVLIVFVLWAVVNFISNLIPNF